MKKNKFWAVILIYWIAFVVYNIFLEPISSLFPFYDFTEGSGKYHYGACSFSITVSFVLLVIAIIDVIRKIKKYELMKENRNKVAVVVGVLVISFAIQFFYYLSHFSYFYLFGIVMW